jgi:hypothetical protein
VQLTTATHDGTEIPPLHPYRGFASYHLVDGRRTAHEELFTRDPIWGITAGDSIEIEITGAVWREHGGHWIVSATRSPDGLRGVLLHRDDPDRPSSSFSSMRLHFTALRVACDEDPPSNKRMDTAERVR